MQNPFRRPGKGGTYYLPGAHNKQCDRTGKKVKSTEVKREWNNLMVRTKSWLPRQPLDFLRAIKDDQHVDDPRPWPTTDKFLTSNEVQASDYPGF